MSDEKKLSDDLEDMLGDAKEGVKKAAEKAEDFAKEAKEKTSEFVEDAKETLSEGDGKGVAIIAHITLIGWVIALIMNSSNKTELGSFYIRQVLGLMLFSLLSWIPVLGWIIGLVCLVLWVVSLINSIGGKLTPIPIVGEKFQEWFKSI